MLPRWPLVDWLLTYLVHSTLLLGVAWLARLALRERRLALQEAILRAALVGGFATASLQIGLGLHPLGGALAVPASRAAASAPPATAHAVAPAAAHAVAPAAEHAVASAAARGPWPAAAPGMSPGTADDPSPPTAPDLSPSTAPDPSPTTAPDLAPRGDSRWRGRPVVASDMPAWAEAAIEAVTERWRVGLALAWATLAALALARLGVASRRLRRLLRDRRPIDSGELAPEAARLGVALGLRLPVRLSAVERLSVPLATGVLRPEVCLPARAVAELAPDEQVALCAHELAHVARRDPAWVLLARLAEALAPVQPLNAWARRRLQDLAECLSDDLAVTASVRPLGLARSLVGVASWTLGERLLLPAAAAGALSARSRLGHRVERLMDPVRALERPRRLLLPVAAVAVLATALVTPVVSGSATPQEPQPVPEALPVPEAPSAPPARLPRGPHPAPESPPTPVAVPAPPAPPATPPHPAPTARPARTPHPTPTAEVLSPEARERLEQLSRQIAERTRLHETEMKKLEAEVEALVSRIRPREAELERLGQEMEKAARALAESVRADFEAGTGVARKSEQTAEAARRMAEAGDQLRESLRALRVPSDEIRVLAEKARAMAEKVRPSADELDAIRRLSDEAARQGVRESADQARDAMRIAEEALRQAREALREVRERPSPEKPVPEKAVPEKAVPEKPVPEKPVPEKP
jgi:beta-lactamase regulating signal transducer with metallopeptidase domain